MKRATAATSGRVTSSFTRSVHQYVYVQFAASVEQHFKQQRQIPLAIVVVEKAGQSTFDALNEVLRYTGQVES